MAGVPVDGGDAQLTEVWGKQGNGFWRMVRWHVLPRLFTIWLISLITFAATNAIGVNVAQRTLGREASPQELALFRKEHGLDRPLVVQYTSWLTNFVQGDWGVSPVSGRPVREGVLIRFRSTLLLALAALALSVPLSIGLGVFMAKRIGRPLELLLSIGTVAVAATPIFVLGILLIYIFSVRFGWTPVDSSGLAFGDAQAQVEAYILPAIALAISIVPHVGRITRASVRETLTAPYARAAVLRGLESRTITWRYLLPNAAAPIVNVVALNIMWLLGGVIIIENVFAFPGLGTLLVSSVQSGDLITVQAITMVIAIMFVTITLIADLVVVALNPRLRAQ